MYSKASSTKKKPKKKRVCVCGGMGGIQQKYIENINYKKNPISLKHFNR